MKKSSARHSLLSSSMNSASAVTLLSLAVVFSMPAKAQVDDPDTEADSGRSSKAIEEVVVTATRRAMSAQEVPASLTVFDAASIEQMNIRTASDFMQQTPNVQIRNVNNAGETLITIRGDSQTRNTSPPVALVVDGVVLTGRSQLSGDLYDIERIEVLKGPQGFLYGRNAIAGAIIIETKKPGNQFEGDVEFGYGRFDTAEARISYGGPLIEDELFFRLSGSLIDSEGFYTNVTRQEKMFPRNEKNFRGRLIWEPTEEFDADFRFNYKDNKQGGVQWKIQSAIPGLQTSPQAAVLDVNRIEEQPWVRNVEARSFHEETTLALKLSYDFGPFELQSATNYDQFDDGWSTDDLPYASTPDGTQFNLFSHESLSTELRVQSRGDQKLSYTLGVYYADIDNDPDRITAEGVDDTATGRVLDARNPRIGPDVLNRTLTFNESLLYTEAWAAFAHFNYQIAPSLAITVAGRYDRDEVKQIDASPPEFSPTAGLVREDSWEEFQPKFDITWNPTDDILLYGGFAKGFQSGGFNNPTAPIASGGIVSGKYDESTAENWEFGFNSRWFQDRLTFNMAVFQNDKKNSQQFVFVPAGNVNAVQVIDEVEISGFEAELTARPIPELDVRAGLGMLDAEIKEYASEPDTVGNRAPFTAELTGNLSVTYTRELAGLSLFGVARPEARINVTYEHRGDQYFNADNTPGTKRDALNIVNANVALRLDDWTIEAWVQNLTDEIYPADVIPVFTAPALQTQAVFQSPPRMWGVSFKYAF
ncbi:TonB-dependent receptor [Lentisalinibacter orientalis]|uniref:TonB-dependent receptor n=1 Tax=Lentisalinibacter orientalis TaxID=2992241 RepID=UPI003865C2AF